MACLSPILVGRDKFPCGKCTECIKMKQLDYAQVMAFQASKKGSAHFVTFTYQDDHLPIRLLDMESGEIRYLSDSQGDSLLRSDYYKSLPQVGSYRRYVHSLWFQRPTYNMCASLRRRDFRLWLKRVRVYYERETGEHLPEFTYLCIGEYGEKTYRPHYHALFFGLSDRFIAYMVHDWNKRFGYTLAKTLPVASNQDVAKCCMYVAKYMNKGCADCPELFIPHSLMEKPRLMLSCGMSVRQGTRSLLTLDGALSLNQQSYDISDIERVIERMKFHFGGNDYILGKHFYLAALQIPNVTFNLPYCGVDNEVTQFQTLFQFKYEKDNQIFIEEVKKPVSATRFKASPLQVAISYLLRTRANERDNRARQMQFDFFSSDPSLLQIYGSFENYEERDRYAKAKASYLKRKKSVSKSVF